jgi:RNA polymerase sigma factor (sigma-70 family)
MPSRQTKGVTQQLLRLTQQDDVGLTDGQLLDSFTHRRDEAALSALIKRHAPMVWGVCRRLLRNHHDTEDAFQATFLVLVRKASTVRDKESLTNWLYGVARQTAVRLRAIVARRQRWEQQVINIPEPVAAESNRDNGLQTMLDQELSALPKKYRLLIILCDLEGKTRKEAAGRLGCPEGTVNGRLARARVMLARRLARRGLVVPVGTLASVLLQNASIASIPPKILSSAIDFATHFARGRMLAGTMSVQVADLTHGVLKAMLLNKLKKVSLAVMFLAGALGMCAWFSRIDAAELPPSQSEGTDTAKSAPGQFLAEQEEPPSKPTADNSGKPKAEEIEKKQLESRLSIKSGHFVVKAGKTMEIWLDGAKRRVDQTNGDGDRAIKCLNEKICITWTPAPPGVRPQIYCWDRDTAEKSKVHIPTDPRKIGILTGHFVNMVNFPIDRWITRNDRSEAVVSENTLDGRKVWKVAFKINPGTSVKDWSFTYWSDPCYDLSIVRLESEFGDPKTDYKETVQTELQFLSSSSSWLPYKAIWFPKKSLVHRYENEKLVQKELIEMKEVRLNAKIDPKLFEFEGLGLPKGTSVSNQSTGERGEWDGEKLIPSKPGRKRPPQ